MPYSSAKLIAATFKWSYILGLLVIVELILQTVLPKANWVAVLYVLVGLSIPLIALFARRTSAIEDERTTKIGKFSLLHLALLSLLALWMLWRGGAEIRGIPLDYHMADMLPVIQIMSERWLAGDAVYAIIPDIWDGVQPIYMPALYLPYALGTVFEFDIRWMSLLALWAGVAALVTSWRQSASPISMLVWVPIGYLFFYVLQVYPGLLTITEEPVVIAWYLLLAAGLLRQQAWWIGVCLAGCWLSRYTLAFWTLMLFPFVWLHWGKVFFKQMLAAALITGLLLLWISQAWQEIDLFLSLPRHYLDNLQNPDAAWSYRRTIANNLGLARLLDYEQLPGLMRVNLFGSLLLPWIVWWAYRRWASRIDPSLFLIASLKLSLVFFFNTLAQPYSYLFYTSGVMGIALWLAFIRKPTPISPPIK